MFLKEVFEISDILLMDKDDMVQKGYGWMLKEASKKHQAEVFDYVMKWKAKMPQDGAALCYREDAGGDEKKGDGEIDDFAITFAIPHRTLPRTPGR